jgi:Mg2+/Co2+ transporter CorB
VNDIPLTTLFATLAGLLVLSAFFSGSETALMSINRYRLLHLAREGSRGARLARKLLEQPDRLIGLILLGNNFVNILASALTTLAFVRIAGEAGLLIGTATLTVTVLIFAEVAPKTLAAFHPERVALPASYVLYPLLRMTYPFVWVVNVLANGVLRLFGHRSGKTPDTAMSQDELRTVLLEGGGLIPDQHRRMLLNILALQEAYVEDIMVPRGEIIGIDLDDDPQTLRDNLARFPFSRAPVYHGSIDQVAGILHLRTLMDVPAGQITPALVEARARKVYFIPEGVPLPQQLLEFQRMKRRFAMVVDEYGEVIGMVTMADILEEIVGEFTTTPSQDSRHIHHEPDGTLLIDGRIAVHSLNRRLDWGLPTDDARTLSGLLVSHNEALPEPGAEFEIEGFRMRVERLGDNVIAQVRVWPPNPSVRED